MKVTILGNSAPYAGRGRACSGYLLRSEGGSVLVDCGPGVVARLQDHIDLGDISAIVLSHFHADHFADLLTLKYAVQLGKGTGVYDDPIPLFIPREGSTKFLETYITDGYLQYFDVNIIFDGARYVIEDQVFSFTRVTHAVPAYGMRVHEAGSEDRVYAYSADTGKDEAVYRVAKDAEVFMCEASWQDASPRNSAVGHLSAREAGEIAKASGVNRLILTHLFPEHDPAVSEREASEAFGRKVIVGVEGETYEI